MVPGGQMGGWVPCRASTVSQPLVWMCRWAGVLPWAQAPTCCTSTGCESSLWPSGSVTVCGCSSVAAPQKGARGGWRGRISPMRCVSSMLICHPLNLYCSSTGSISHIARTFVLLWLRSLSRLQTKTDKKQRKVVLAVITQKTPAL